MLFELRTYQCAPGRKADLLRRFEQKTIAIWARHGIAPVGFWTSVIGPSSEALIYMLAWQSLADRESKWAAFLADSEWQAVAQETEKDGPLYTSFSNQILAPTLFSPLQ